MSESDQDKFSIYTTMCDVDRHIDSTTITTYSDPITDSLNISGTRWWLSDDDTITIQSGNPSPFDSIVSDATTFNTTWSTQGLNLSKVENMCKHYPALQKAFDNFKTVYEMVEQDYEGKRKSGEIDDDIPF